MIFVEPQNGVAVPWTCPRSGRPRLLQNDYSSHGWVLYLAYLSFALLTCYDAFTDLQTVMKRLQCKYYSKLSDLVGDVSLIFDNCRQYNGPESNVVKCAEIVETVFVGRIRDMRGRWRTKMRHLASSKVLIKKWIDGKAMEGIVRFILVFILFYSVLLLV